MAMPDKNKLADLPNELLVWFPEWSEKSNYNNNSNKFGKSNAAIWLISFILLSLIHCWLYFMNQQTEDIQFLMNEIKNKPANEWKQNSTKPDAAITN